MNLTEDSCFLKWLAFTQIASTENNPTQPILHTWLYLIQVLYLLIFLSGLIGNGLVIYMFFRFPKIQTVTNFYFLNLAIADACFLLGTPLLMLSTILENWPFGSVLCKVYFITTSIHDITTSVFIAVIVFDKYLSTCHPATEIKWRTTLVNNWTALIYWLISCILFVPIAKYSYTTDIGSKTTCNTFWPDSAQISGVFKYLLYVFLFGFTIPFLVSCTFCIIMVIKEKFTNPKLILTLINIHFITRAFNHATQVLVNSPNNPTENPDKVWFLLLLLSGCLSYANSTINPAIYVFLLKDFSDSLKILFCRCENSSSGESSLMLQPSSDLFALKGTTDSMRNPSV